MNSLLLAIQFLTRLPIHAETEFNEKEAGKSLFWFPWISFVMGVIVGFVNNFFYDVGPLFGAFLGLLTWYLLNGGLHMDGLMDTADGFLSNRERDRVVEIMHDSTIGVFAVLALALIVLGKFSVLASVAIQPLEMGIFFASVRMGVLTAIHFSLRRHPRPWDTFLNGAPRKTAIIFSGCFSPRSSSLPGASRFSSFPWPPASGARFSLDCP